MTRSVQLPQSMVVEATIAVPRPRSCTVTVVVIPRRVAQAATRVGNKSALAVGWKSSASSTGPSTRASTLPVGAEQHRPAVVEEDDAVRSSPRRPCRGSRGRRTGRSGRPGAARRPGLAYARAPCEKSSAPSDGVLELSHAGDRASSSDSTSAAPEAATAAKDSRTAGADHGAATAVTAAPLARSTGPSGTGGTSTASRCRSRVSRRSGARSSVPPSPRSRQYAAARRSRPRPGDFTGPARAAERLGDLGLAQVLVVAEHDHGPLPRRQRPDGAVQIASRSTTPASGDPIDPIDRLDRSIGADARASRKPLRRPPSTSLSTIRRTYASGWSARRTRPSWRRPSANAFCRSSSAAARSPETANAHAGTAAPTTRGTAPRTPARSAAHPHDAASRPRGSG